MEVVCLGKCIWYRGREQWQQECYMLNTALYMCVYVQGRKGRGRVEDVCAGSGSFSMLFAVANVKPGRSKKTISRSCYISTPDCNRSQKVRLRKEAEYYTEILNFEMGHISWVSPTFNRGHSLSRINECFMQEFQISAIGTSPTCPPTRHTRQNLTYLLCFLLNMIAIFRVPRVRTEH